MPVLLFRSRQRPVQRSLSKEVARSQVPELRYNEFAESCRSTSRVVLLEMRILQLRVMPAVHSRRASDADLRAGHRGGVQGAQKSVQLRHSRSNDQAPALHLM